MKNHIQEGKFLDYTVPSGGVTSGALVEFGDLIGIAVTDGDENDVVAIAVTGVFEVAKATGAITAGQSLYFDSGNDNLTTTAASNKFAGFAVEAQGSSDTTVKVLLRSAGTNS